MTEQRPRRRLRRCAPWAAGAMAAGYVALAITVSARPGSSVDLAVALAIQRATALDPVWRAASVFGYLPIGAVLPIAVIVVLFVAPARRDAVALTLALLGAVGTEYATRFVFPRPRPSAPVLVRDGQSGPGFPSGHVISYVVLFGFLAVLAGARVRSRAVRVAAIAAAVIVIALVGPSRVYLGAHWPSDVLGGYLVGGAWLVLVTPHVSRSSLDSAPGAPRSIAGV